jgi:hypothetical protein
VNIWPRHKKSAQSVHATLTPSSVDQDAGERSQNAWIKWGVCLFLSESVAKAAVAGSCGADVCVRQGHRVEKFKVAELHHKMDSRND